MLVPTHRKIISKLFHQPYQKKLTIPSYFLKYSTYLSDVFLFIFFSSLLIGLILYVKHCIAPLQPKVEINFSTLSLLKYTFFSMSRGLIAFAFSLFFSLFWGIWSGKDRIAERTLIPILDIMQSIPVLGFMPGLVLLLISCFPHRNLGLELACILMIFTGQAWNMAFGVYHSIRTVPLEKIESAKVYRFGFWRCLKWVEIPFSMISLTWNSMLSMAGGWFFLMISEAFQLGNKDFRLPGLGSYMSVAAAEGNISEMISSVIAMVILIVFLDQCLWRPLVVWSQKFRIEDVEKQENSNTWFLQILKSSKIISYFRSRPKITKTSQSLEKNSFYKSEVFFRRFSTVLLCILFSILAIGLFYLMRNLKEIAISEWMDLIRMSGLTLSKVLICLCIGALVSIPLGLWIGLSEKLSRFFQPLIQITASFPATLLFPALVLLLKTYKIPLQIGSIILMLTGTIWYFLFNVLAGTKAIPTDLKEATTSFKLTKFQKWKTLYLPGIFPYLITGAITAAGGAWNASIVAEYVSYNGMVWTTPGLGSMISIQAQEGNIPLLLASITTMSCMVVFLNYQVWLRLYHFSEKRFALNY